MKLLKVSDDSGFIGIANFDKYNSFISKSWDYDSMKKRIIKEINHHNLLFWATGLEGIWSIVVDNQPSDKNSYREGKGVIEVTDERLYLTNYESLTMAAQFDNIKLPEKHLENLAVELKNGKYMVKFRQMFNPYNFNLGSDAINFEIILTKIEKNLDLYRNNVSGIYWSDY